jgi:hypothetical protein
MYLPSFLPSDASMYVETTADPAYPSRCQHFHRRNLVAFPVEMWVTSGLRPDINMVHRAWIGFCKASQALCASRSKILALTHEKAANALLASGLAVLRVNKLRISDNVLSKGTNPETQQNALEGWIRKNACKELWIGIVCEKILRCGVD